MEADSTSSLQRKDSDHKPTIDVSQESESTRGEYSQAEDTGTIQSLVEQQREVKRSETIKAKDNNESYVAEQTGIGPQTTKNEGDESKEEETFSHDSEPSRERLEEDVLQNFPEDVASADIPVEHNVQEKSQKVSETLISSVRETPCTDGVINSEVFSPSAGLVSDTSHPDTAGFVQNRMVEGAVSSTFHAERITDREMETEEGPTHFGEEIATAMQTESILKGPGDDTNVSPSSISAEKDFKCALPSESDTTTSTSCEASNEKGRVEQQTTHVVLPGSQSKVDETEPMDGKETSQETGGIKESCSRGTVELDNAPSSPRQVHEPPSISDQTEDKESLTITSEAAEPTEMDITDVGDFVGSKEGEEEVMDTNKESQGRSQENAESFENEKKEETFEREEEKEETKPKQEEDAEMQDGEEAASVAEAEAVTKDGDKNDEKDEECKEANGDGGTGEEVEGEEEAGKEMGEEDDQDEEEKEDSPEGKSERRRASPIRCFDESSFTVEKLFEYQWPQDHGEFFFVQEQISEYLGVTSFKRKYPALERRLIALEERRFLKDKGVVTEEQVTLGLTALKADEVYDVMQKDFPDKYADYARLIQQRQREAVKNQHKEYGTPAVDSTKMKNYIKKAVRQAAEYNASLMRERREERQYYLDLQTMLVHCPVNRMKKLTKEQSKPGAYPVAVIPGQFQNYYKNYTPEELKYLPVNTAIYGPMATQKQSDIAPSGPPGSEVSSDEEDLSVSSEPQKTPSKGDAAPKATTKSSSSKTAVKSPSKGNTNKSNGKSAEKPSKANTSKGSSKSTEKTSKGNNNNKGNSKSTEKPAKRQAPIEPPFDHERITPAFFKDQVQSVLPVPPRETPMISLQPAPMVSLAPPPPVTQVLSQLLQQRAIVPPKPTQYVPKDIPDAICGLCLKDRESNRKGEPEELVHCSQCDNSGHPSCLEMSAALVCAIKTYPWQCMECKTCTLCGDPTHEDKMMFCDECDRGYHTFCVGLTELPTGLWACASCRCAPPARPLPPPPVEVPPPPLNGTPEAMVQNLQTGDAPNTPTNGVKRPAEPLQMEEVNENTALNDLKEERMQAPTPPPAKKKNSKKKQATPAKS